MQDQLQDREDNPYLYNHDEDEDLEDDFIPQTVVKRAQQEGNQHT